MSSSIDRLRTLSRTCRRVSVGRQGEGAIGPGKGYEAPQPELQSYSLAPVISRSQCIHLHLGRCPARRHSPNTLPRNVGGFRMLDSTTDIVLMLLNPTVP